jgi:hypothetical protein
VGDVEGGEVIADEEPEFGGCAGEEGGAVWSRVVVVHGNESLWFIDVVEAFLVAECMHHIGKIFPLASVLINYILIPLLWDLVW